MFLLYFLHVTVGCPSVRPSVRLSHRSTAAMADGGFAAERRRLQRISLDSCGAALHAPVLGSECG